MYGYRILRSVTLGLRSAQTALLAASFVVADTAQQLGDKARELAHRKLDKIVNVSAAKSEAAWAAVGNLEAIAAQRSADHLDLYDDVAERRQMIEREVL